LLVWTITVTGLAGGRVAIAALAANRMRVAGVTLMRLPAMVTTGGVTGGTAQSIVRLFPYEKSCVKFAL
jgi:hypothetical protein